LTVPLTNPLQRPLLLAEDPARASTANSVRPIRQTHSDRQSLAAPQISHAPKHPGITPPARHSFFACRRRSKRRRRLL